MKIVGIVGILDLPGSEKRAWKSLREAFASEFPNSEFVVEHSSYLPWQGERLRRFRDHIQSKYDTGEDVILIGYSLGGVVAHALAGRFAMSKVRALVTIHAPHRVRLLNTMLGTRPLSPAKVPILTFGGLLDAVVPWFFSRLPNSVHMNFLTDHVFSFTVRSLPARKIAERTKQVLSEPAA